MKTLILICTLMAFQSITPEAVVQKQLDAYNAKDLYGFMATMSETVALYEFGQETPAAMGFESVKEIYSNLFKNSPNLHSTLVNRIVMGNKVIDHESIVGRSGSSGTLELSVVYEVNDEMKIEKITVIRM